MAERWSGKKVQALLIDYSNNEKNFKTKRSGRGVKIYPKGYSYCTHGYFVVQGAYGGYKLEYILPYTGGATTDVSSGGFQSSGKLAEYLMALGPSGLKLKFRSLEKRYKPTGRERFKREKLKYEAENKKTVRKK